MKIRTSSPTLRDEPNPCGASAIRMASVVLSALLGLGLSQFAVAADASSMGTGGASADYAAGPAAAPAANPVSATPARTYQVQPGAGLGDIAADVGQTNDKAVRDRVAEALFKANPRAFIAGDRNRLRLGAVLTIPDGVGPATDSAAASSATSVAASSAATSAGSASGVPLGGPVAASTPATGAATAAAMVAASTALTAPAAPLVAQPAVVASAALDGKVVPSPSPASASAVSAVPFVASSSTINAAPESASTPAIVDASSLVQASAAVGASALAMASAAAIAPASQALVKTAPGSAELPAHGAGAAGFASLEQLLALKNRVLMALEKHGISSNAQTTPSGVAAVPGAASTSVASSAIAQPSSAAAGRNVPTGSSEWQALRTNPSTVPALLVIVLVLLLALFTLMPRRKKGGIPGDEVEAARPGARASASVRRIEKPVEPVGPAASAQEEPDPAMAAVPFVSVPLATSDNASQAKSDSDPLAVSDSVHRVVRDAIPEVAPEAGASPASLPLDEVPRLEVPIDVPAAEVPVEPVVADLHNERNKRNEHYKPDDLTPADWAAQYAAVPPAPAPIQAPAETAPVFPAPAATAVPEVDPEEARLREALAQAPFNAGLLLEFAALYAQRGDVDGFSELFFELRMVTESKGPHWERALELGSEVARHNAVHENSGGAPEAGEHTVPESAGEAHVPAPVEPDVQSIPSIQPEPQADRPVDQPVQDEPSTAGHDERVKAVLSAVDLSLPEIFDEPIVPTAQEGETQPLSGTTDVGAQSDVHHESPVPVPSTTPLTAQEFSEPEISAPEIDVSEISAQKHDGAQFNAPEFDAPEFAPHESNASEHPIALDFNEPESHVPGHGVPDFGISEAPLEQAPPASSFPEPQYHLEPDFPAPSDESRSASEVPWPTSVAGSSAAKFAAFDLDFDLDLPEHESTLPGVPAAVEEFDPVAVAQNKLELAHEYVALGDVAGARALINEALASNDATTRDAARVLLGSLAPLS